MTSPTELGVPTNSKLKIPVLQALSDGETHSVDDIVSKVIEIMKIPEDIANIPHHSKNGGDKRTELNYRVYWVLTTLFKEKLISKPSESMRKIEDLGFQYLRENMKQAVAESDSGDMYQESDDSEDSKEGNPGVESFFEYLSSIGLQYETRTVEDFLLSLKAKMFVILSGTTGTGKTMLAKAYGEYLSSHQEKRYLIVPVGSNWTDNRHILGYKNAISGVYSSTNSLDFLIKTNGDSASPYILILDEMNMSQVERYLADLISCMESGEPVVLDSDGSDGIPERLWLRENLIVVGTVNMDETTQSFSPKVLDRANVIEFSPSPVSLFLTGESPQYSPAGDVLFLQDPLAGLECRSMTAREIIEEISGKNPGFGDAVTKDLEEIQNLMGGIGMSFGYRTLNEVMRFMYVAWRYEGGEAFDNWKRYMDDQILQKILPKVRGNSSILECLTKLSDFCAGHGYERSNEKLMRMIEVLKSQRYVSFDCR